MNKLSYTMNFIKMHVLSSDSSAIIRPRYEPRNSFVWSGGNFVHQSGLEHLFIYLVKFNVPIFLSPRDRRSRAYCFCPVCHSVLLSETVSLLITFVQWVLQPWYFTWAFLVIRPFCGYHYFLHCDLDLGAWPF